jgi:hypothetical protein
MIIMIESYLVVYLRPMGCRRVDRHSKAESLFAPSKPQSQLQPLLSLPLPEICISISSARSFFAVRAEAVPGIEKIGGPLQQRYCEDGLRLDTTYFEKTRVWVGAEADKRVAIGVSRGVGINEWNEIARRADEAKRGHEQALRDYMEHVFSCPVCNAHLLASSNKYMMQHLH